MPIMINGAHTGHTHSIPFHLLTDKLQLHPPPQSNPLLFLLTAQSPPTPEMTWTIYRTHPPSTGPHSNEIPFPRKCRRKQPPPPASSPKNKRGSNRSHVEYAEEKSANSYRTIIIEPHLGGATHVSAAHRPLSSPPSPDFEFQNK